MAERTPLSGKTPGAITNGMFVVGFIPGVAPSTDADTALIDLSAEASVDYLIAAIEAYYPDAFSGGGGGGGGGSGLPTGGSLGDLVVNTGPGAGGWGKIPIAHLLEVFLTATEAQAKQMFTRLVEDTVGAGELIKFNATADGAEGQSVTEIPLVTDKVMYFNESGVPVPKSPLEFLELAGDLVEIVPSTHDSWITLTYTPGISHIYGFVATITDHVSIASVVDAPVGAIIQLFILQDATGGWEIELGPGVVPYNGWDLEINSGAGEMTHLKISILPGGITAVGLAGKGNP